VAPAHWERLLCPAAAEPPACQPARRPFGASVGESPVVGAEPAAVPAASSSSLFPSPPSPSHPRTLFTPPSRLRHLPAPHTQNKNALPGTTQQHLDGFGHGSAVAYPQHHLQPLCLGESLPAAAPLASVTAAPLWLSGSRRTPLRTRRSQALALGCREPPTPSSSRCAAGTTRRRFLPPSPCAPSPSPRSPHNPPVACLPMAEHFLSGMSHPCFSPSPFLYPLLLCCREGTGGLQRCPLLTLASPYHHHFRGPFRICIVPAPFFELVGVCVPYPLPPPPPQSLAVFLVLCTVQAPWGC
jgi:hypothetical protein